MFPLIFVSLLSCTFWILKYLSGIEGKFSLYFRDTFYRLSPSLLEIVIAQYSWVLILVKFTWQFQDLRRWIWTKTNFKLRLTLNLRFLQRAVCSSTFHTALHSITFKPYYTYKHFTQPYISLISFKFKFPT